MASVSKRKWADSAGGSRKVAGGRKGESWQVAWTEDGKRKKKAGFKTKAEAEKFGLEKETEIAAGVSRPMGDKMTVADACAAYIKHMESRVKQDTVVPEYQSSLAGHVKNYIARTDDWKPNVVGKRARSFTNAVGGFALRKLRPVHVEQFRDDLLETGLNYGTVRGILTTLSGVLDYARRKEWVAVNAAHRIKVLIPRSARSLRRTPPPAESVLQAIEQADPRMKFLIQLIAATGLRSGELRGLRYRCIDLDAMTLTVEASANSKNIIGPPKSNGGFRDIPISPQFAEAYEHFRQNAVFSGDDDLVLANKTGGVVPTTNLRYELKKLFERNGWPNEPAQSRTAHRRFNIHELRHFAVSSWIAADLGLKAVQTWAGHADVKMTWNRYGHLFPDDRHAGKIEQASREVFKTH